MKKLYDILMKLCFVLTGFCTILFIGQNFLLKLNSGWRISNLQVVAQTWPWLLGAIVFALLGSLFYHLIYKGK